MMTCWRTRPRLQIGSQSRRMLESRRCSLTAVIKPQGPTLVIARDHLIEYGCTPPVISDDWWLDVAAAAESNDMEGGFQETMGWGRWGFPLPPSSKEPAERGLRLAWAVMQLDWQREAQLRPVTQVPHPELVADFIQSMPGLAEVCHTYTHYMVSYAPQLVIQGMGGEFEPAIEAAYSRSRSLSGERRASGSAFDTALTADGRAPRCDDEFALRDPGFGGFDAAHVACGFVQGMTLLAGRLFATTATLTTWLGFCQRRAGGCRSPSGSFSPWGWRSGRLGSGTLVGTAASLRTSGSRRRRSRILWRRAKCRYLAENLPAEGQGSPGPRTPACLQCPAAAAPRDRGRPRCLSA